MLCPNMLTQQTNMLCSHVHVVTRKKWIFFVALVFLAFTGVYLHRAVVYSTNIKRLSAYSPIASTLQIHQSNISVSSDHLVHVLTKQHQRRLQTRTHNAPNLSQDVIDGVKQFLLFVGYPRSGHSILGSMIDAHPHVVVAHELFLLDEWWSEQEKKRLKITKELLYNALYTSSSTNVRTGWRNTSSRTKGYSLNLGYSWQGHFNKSVTVIGDKSGGNTAYLYMKSPDTFLKRYEELKRIAGVPVRVIHVVRNPFDIIATTTLYESGKIKFPGLGRGAEKVSNFVHEVKTRFRTMKNKTINDRLLNQARLRDKQQLNNCIDYFTKMASAVKVILNLMTDENVLEVHNYEMVRDPARTMERVCQFLGVSCPEDYVKACVSKIFPQLSLSREYVLWGRKEMDKVNSVKEKYSYFKQYSFYSDI